MTKPLGGKTALVTGASRGIGRAIAHRLAADGAAVLVHYGRSREPAEALVAELGGGAVALGADLATTAGVEQLAADVKAHLARRPLDILVNNAGIVEYGALEETSADALDRMLAVNVRAPFVLTARLAASIPDGGRIVFTTTAVTQAYFPAIAGYAASKGAIDVLIRHLAAELGPRGIRVTGVAPGATHTDMAAWLDDDAGKANALSMQALQRIGQPEDIANAVAFLAGPDAAWVTGQIVQASGGLKL